MSAQRGNVTLMAAASLPLMIALVALVVNVGALAYKRARLDVVVDRGVFVGASSLAHSLDMIAEDNWKIHKAQWELERWLKRTSEPSKEELDKRFREARETQSKLIDDIEKINGGMFEKALDAAQSVVEANVSGTGFVPFFYPDPEGMMIIGTGEEDGAHYGDLRGADIVGVVFDPSSYSVESPERVLEYLEKNPRADVVFGGWAVSTSPPPVFSELFGGQIEISSASAAQPYGGSMARFAEINIDDDDPPLSEAREHLYRAAFIPVGFATDKEPYVLR